MKILQVNNVYGEKSTGKITEAVHLNLLEQGYESLVVYGRGPGKSEKGVIRLCPDWYGKMNALLSRITGIPYGGCLLSTWRLQRIILREKPDVVHLQCINGNFVNIYRLITWLKKHKMKTVVSLHAEFMHTANCGYAFDCNQWQKGCRKCPNKYKAVKSWFFDRTGDSWKKMQRAFDGFEEKSVICPVSPWTEERAKQSGILRKQNFQTVYNGVKTKELFHFEPMTRKVKNTVLNVTSWFCNDENNIKGGWYLIQLAERMPDVTFYVAGKTDTDLKLPKNIVLLGEIRNQKELADWYRKVSLSVIVSKKETFSMPCAESLCCGTPVVGFRAGAPEQISLPEYSSFVEHGNLDALERTIRFWIERKDLQPARIAESAEAVYSVESMVNNFINVYRSIV